MARTGMDKSNMAASNMTTGLARVHQITWFDAKHPAVVQIAGTTAETPGAKRPNPTHKGPHLADLDLVYLGILAIMALAYAYSTNDTNAPSRDSLVGMVKWTTMPSPHRPLSTGMRPPTASRGPTSLNECPASPKRAQPTWRCMGPEMMVCLPISSTAECMLIRYSCRGFCNSTAGLPYLLDHSQSLIALDRTYAGHNDRFGMA